MINSDDTNCNDAISHVATSVICFISLLGICQGVHILLKPLSQPTIISEIIISFHPLHFYRMYVLSF